MCEKMTFGVQKMKRGQVWFCNESTDVTNALRDAHCRALNGARPYFIVNVNGVMCNCIPMTTNTVGTDTKDTNIIFEDPISGITSKLCINQITTKGVDEFSEYKYTFDEAATETIIDKIKACIFGEDTSIVPYVKEEAKEIKTEEPIKEKPSTPSVLVLPDERKQFEMRLVSYFKLPSSKRKAEQMFRTQREGMIFMTEFHDKPTEELAKTFGIDKPTVYRMRSKAKEAAYRKEAK